MRLLSSLIEDENINENSSKIYEISKIYVGRLVRIINTKPKNMDSRYYFLEKCEQEQVLLKHETGEIYTDIETGERYTLGLPSIVRFDRDYSPNKLYVSPTYLEKFKRKCYYILRDYHMLDDKYLTTQKFREILDEEDIKSCVLNKYHY